MPRMRTPATLTAWYLFRGNKSDTMRKTGITRKTFYNRIDHPGELKLSELGPLVEANELTDEQIVTIVRAWS